MKNIGLLIRAHGGFFDVQTEEYGLLRCRARGRLHLNGTEPLAGDRVIWQRDSHHPEYGILTGIEPRKNVFVRPSVANIDQMIFVASVARPRTDPFLIDQMSVVAAAAGCEFILCVNKEDLEPVDRLASVYHSCGFRVIRTSTVTENGLTELREVLSGSVSVLTGNSGVGKTSLLNLLIPGLSREVAEISEKRGRGRHTTRLTELFPLPGSGYVADTPGFAALELERLTSVSEEELSLCFPEFPQGSCRFPDCLHRGEPQCAVREKMEAGELPESRYTSYLRLLNQVSKKNYT